MRIFDLPLGTPGKDKATRLAVVGSCRVHDPFEDVASAGRLERVWANPQAVTRTLGEAEQILRFTLNQIDILPEVRPFVFQSPDAVPSQRPSSSRLLQGIDLLVVEFCQIEELIYEGYFLQTDLFWQRFVSHYGAPLLPWYRMLTAGKVASKSIVEDAVQQLKIPEDEQVFVQNILMKTQMRQTDIAWARDRIASIDAMVPSERIYVSHFLVPGETESAMRSRFLCRDILSTTAIPMGNKIFDPTGVVERLGRTQALARQGQDIYHYNPQIQHVVADEIMKTADLDPSVGATAIGNSRRIQENAKRLNNFLVAAHGQRLALLGREGSGLYEHYETLLRREEIVDPAHVNDVVRVTVDLLPQYEDYHVLRAGLGEVAFLLASLGRRVVAADASAARLGAIEFGLRHLTEQQFLAEGIVKTANVLFPDISPECPTLAIATQLTAGVPSDDVEFALRELALRYQGILLIPENFVGARASWSDRDLLLDRINKHGFTHTRDLLGGRVVYCAKR